MSRAYRITVKESSMRDLKGSDEICTRLEVLDILPPDATVELLRKELQGKGFTEQPDGTFVRQEGNITVKVDPKSCEVSVKADVQEQVQIDVKREGSGYDDVGPGQREVREKVQSELRKDIDEKAEKETNRLQGQATKELEEKLCELQPELSEIVNRVTRQALKQKAQQLGNVKEIAEDEASGSLTIRIEV